jgi:hypothetical protein
MSTEHVDGTWHRLLRTLAVPSSEVQGDAIGIAAVALLGVGAGAAAIARGVPAAAMLPSLVGVAAVGAGAVCEALRKLRYERPYGCFFSTSVAVASDDVVDTDGRRLIRAGVDEVCELHVVRNLDEIAALSRSGMAGRLQVMLAMLEEMALAAADMGDPFYDGVRHVVAYSDLTATLFKLGFAEIGRPPRFDLINRLEKRLLMWRIGRLTGQHRDTDTEQYRMAVATKEYFSGPAFAAALEAQIARARLAIEKARALEAR